MSVRDALSRPVCGPAPSPPVCESQPGSSNGGDRGHREVGSTPSHKKWPGTCANRPRPWPPRLHRSDAMSVILDHARDVTGPTPERLYGPGHAAALVVASLCAPDLTDAQRRRAIDAVLWLRDLPGRCA